MHVVPEAAARKGHLPWPLVEAAILDSWAQATATLFSMRERVELETRAAAAGFVLPDGLSFPQFCRGTAFGVIEDVGEIRLLLDSLDTRTLRRGHRAVKRAVVAWLDGPPTAWTLARALWEDDGDDGVAWTRGAARLLNQVRDELRLDAARDRRKKRDRVMVLVPPATRTTP